MDEETHERKSEWRKSEWRAIGLCLLHVGALFVPIALGMLLLAGTSMQTPVSDGIDQIQTGSIERR